MFQKYHSLQDINETLPCKGYNPDAQLHQENNYLVMHKIKMLLLILLLANQLFALSRLIEKKLQQAGQLPSSPEEGEAEGEPQKMYKDTPATETFVTSYYTFPDNFTTNLKGSKAFLQISVGVSTQYDETVMENVELHQLALRSEILGAVSEFSVEEIEGKDGRDKLANHIKESVNLKLEELEGFGGVEGVFFTSFVLQ